MAAVRLPLQVGTSSLLGFSRVAAAFVPGALLLASLVLPPLFAPWDEAWELYGKYWVLYPFAVGLGLALLGYARVHFWLSLRERPSDVHFDQEGFRVEGGPQHGLTVPWSAVDPDRCQILASRKRNLELFGHEHHDDCEICKKEARVHNFWQLRVGLEGGRTIELASAEGKEEEASFAALCDSIRSMAQAARSGPGSIARQPPQEGVLRCPGCGAPVPPGDADVVQCAYCRGVVPVPRELRARLVALGVRDREQRRSDTLLRRLIRQPGARSTSVALAFSAVPSLLAWPATFVTMVVLYLLAFLRVPNALMLSLSAFAFIVAMFYLVRGRFTDRQALRLLSLHFAARPRPGTDQGKDCRMCGAPLPEAGNALVVRCVHCDAENVMGIDVLRQATTQRSQAASLDEALATRARARSQHRRGWLAALALVALASGGVFLSLGPPHELTPTNGAGFLTRLTYDPLDEFEPQVTKDGHTLLYDLRVRGEHEYEVVMSADAGGAFRGQALTPASAHASRPRVLPAGGFVYVSYGSGNGADLLLASSLDPFQEPKPLAHADWEIDTPGVSPDGNAIVISAADRKKDDHQMFLVGLDGKVQRELGTGYNPAFSPDGRSIAFTSYVDGWRQIWRMNADGSDARALTSGVCHHEDATWSRDSAHIAYIADCAPVRHKVVWNLFVMGSDGQGARALTTGNADMEHPTWVGRDVYFSANVAGNFDVWRVRLPEVL
jgi:hypothetical protein